MKRDGFSDGYDFFLDDPKRISSIQWLGGSQGARGIHIPIYSLLNGEPRSYLEFSDHLVVMDIIII